MRKPSPLYALALVALLAACSGTSSPATTADAAADTAVADAGATDTSKDGVSGDAADNGGKGDVKGDAKGDTAKPDVQVGEPDDEIEGATELTLDVTPLDDALDPTGDVDWYKFEGKKGQLVVVAVATSQTLKGTPQDGTILDTILTLYGPDKKPYALNDDGDAGTNNNDSQIRTVLPADGTYYVQVQECQTWLPNNPDKGSTCTGDAEKEDVDYKIYGYISDPTTETTVITDKEPNDTAATAVPLAYKLNPTSTLKGAYYADVIFGSFTSISDVDVFKFTVPADAPVSEGRATVYFDADKEGPDGNGSTAGPGIAWLASEVSPTVVIAEVDMAKGTLSVPLAFGSTYYLYVKHGPEKAGSNDFYVYQHYVGGSGALEKNEAGNDTFATPETPKVNKNSTSGISYYYVAGDLVGGAKDVDHWQFAVPANAGDTTLSLYCWAGAQGSGLRKMTAALLNATGAPVTIKSSEKDGFFSATGITIKAGEKLTAKITAESQDPKVMGSFYSCQFVFVPPAE